MGKRSRFTPKGTKLRHRPNICGSVPPNGTAFPSFKRGRWIPVSLQRKVPTSFAVELTVFSTDEVFGALQPNKLAFTETTPYSPNSPYSASKASSDHFVRAFHETYSFPTLITNCSDNYGQRQFPENLFRWLRSMP